MATNIMATSTTKLILFHPIRLARSSFIKNAHNLASLGAAYTFAHWHEFEGMAWFTPGFIAQIPDEYIPSLNLQQVSERSERALRKTRVRATNKPTTLSH